MIVKMLDKLKKCGECKGYFESKGIRDFKDAKGELDEITTEAIEFDKTAIEVYRDRRGSIRPPSVDALDIVCSKNKVIFIEFKGLPDELFKQGLPDELLKKVEGSVKTLKIIMEECETSLDFEKKFVLSCFLRYAPKVRELKESFISNILKKKIERILKPFNFEKPKFIGIKDFDEEYKKFRDQTENI